MLAKFTSELFPVVALHTIVVLTLLLLVEPLLQTVDMDEPHTADAFARSDHRVLCRFLVVEADAALFIAVAVLNMGNGLLQREVGWPAQTTRNFRLREFRNARSDLFVFCLTFLRSKQVTLVTILERVSE